MRLLFFRKTLSLTFMYINYIIFIHWIVEHLVFWKSSFPWFFSSKLLEPAQAVLREKSWKKTIFKIMAGWIMYLYIIWLHYNFYTEIVTRDMFNVYLHIFWGEKLSMTLFLLLMITFQCRRLECLRFDEKDLRVFQCFRNVFQWFLPGFGNHKYYKNHR